VKAAARTRWSRAHLLAREFGWTPEQSPAHLGQILLHLQLMKEQQAAHG